MYPELFSIGPITVYSYGVLLAASYLLGLRLAMSRAKKWGLDANRVLDLGIYIIIAALVGAKLLLLVVDFDQFWLARRPAVAGALRRRLLRRIDSRGRRRLLVHRQQRMPFWTTCDVFAPGIALGHVTGRLGCLAAGCCYGKPTDVPWAIVFTNPLAAANVGTPLGIPLHPTQLYEAGAELLILVLLLATERRGRPFAGRTFWGYMLLYAVSRFIIEYLPRRSARRRSGVRHVLDVTVHLADPGAAQPRHAALAVAVAADGTEPESVTARRGVMVRSPSLVP